MLLSVRCHHCVSTVKDVRECAGRMYSGFQCINCLCSVATVDPFHTLNCIVRLSSLVTLNKAPELYKMAHSLAGKS